jgi:SSS family solute:Na+ symporter
MSNLHALDWLVVTGYALIVVVLGTLAHRRQRDTDEYFVGGRDLPWFLVGASILATAFSATSLLGGPGEAYRHGLLWLQLQIGDGLAILVVALLFIPFFRGLGLRTAYEYLERRFGAPARVVASLLFQLQVLFRTGILVYGPSLALSTIVGIDVEWAIILVGMIAIVYTVLGGITAVVWTDVLQLGVVLVGLVLTAALIAAALPGGLRVALELAGEAGRLRVVDPELPWTSVRSLAGAVIGYGILSLSVAGTNQQPVQRYLSCRSVRAAQRAAALGWGIGLLVTAITLLVGALLYAYYQVHAGELPAGMQADAVFPHFIATRLPVGVAGLLVAAIFAAAMSSLDSALNSLATASVVDVYQRFLRPTAGDVHYLRAARVFTVGWGVLGIAAGLYVAGKGGLLEMAVRYMNYFAGPLLGLFLLGLLTRRATGSGALTGMAAAYGALLVIANAETWFGRAAPLGGIWLAATGCAVTIAVGYAASLLMPPPRRERLDGFTVTRGGGAA